MVGGVVVAVTFALAQAQIFEPEASTVTSTTGDAARGATLFEETCAGCHGSGGVGGSPGPPLVETGLDAETVTAVVEQGAGVMPAGLVGGQEQADVVAYVVEISGS